MTKKTFEVHWTRI